MFCSNENKNCANTSERGDNIERFCFNFVRIFLLTIYCNKHAKIITEILIHRIHMFHSNLQLHVPY